MTKQEVIRKELSEALLLVIVGKEKRENAIEDILKVIKRSLPPAWDNREEVKSAVVYKRELEDCLEPLIGSIDEG